MLPSSQCWLILAQPDFWVKPHVSWGQRAHWTGATCYMGNDSAMTFSPLHDTKYTGWHARNARAPVIFSFLPMGQRMEPRCQTCSFQLNTAASSSCWWCHMCEVCGCLQVQTTAARPGSPFTRIAQRKWHFFCIPAVFWARLPAIACEIP